MDRREFLKAAAAVAAASYVPFAESRPALDLATIKGAVEKMWGYTQGDWYVLVSPSQEQDIRDLAARDRWQFAYRSWRKDGKPELTAQQILDKYTPVSEWSFPQRPEIGSYENIRFIETVPEDIEETSK